MVGSRVPRRLRLGPLINRILSIAPVSADTGAVDVVDSVFDIFGEMSWLIWRVRLSSGALLVGQVLRSRNITGTTRIRIRYSKLVANTIDIYSTGNIRRVAHEHRAD